MKERVKVKMEKEVKNRSTNTRASLPKPAMNSGEQINRTKPERSRKLVSFASDLMILANKAAEEDESLSAGIKEDTYEQAVSQGNRELMMQQRAKSTVESVSISHRAAKVLTEAKLNKGLALYKTYKRKKRVNESGLGGCTRFLRHNLSGTLQKLSFGDLVVLANAASIACAREVSKDGVVAAAAEEYMPVSRANLETWIVKEVALGCLKSCGETES